MSGTRQQVVPRRVHGWPRECAACQGGHYLGFLHREQQILVLIVQAIEVAVAVDAPLAKALQRIELLRRENVILMMPFDMVLQ